jgi:hypothetical protein
MNDNNDLRGKIDEAKRRLPLPKLMAQVGLGDRAKKTAHCPFHDDEHKSFSVFQGKDGWWHYRCFAGCGEGDEIMFLSKREKLPLTEAMSLYLEMAGFPPRVPPESHEYPKSRESREFPGSHGFPVSPVAPAYPVYPVSPSPVSKGQETIRNLAGRHACTAPGTERKKLWGLMRDIKAVEKGIGRKATFGELLPFFDEWHSLSLPYLDPEKTREDYLETFMGGLHKVRVPTGEGDTLNKALEAVLALKEYPDIPGIPGAPESWRRVAALHRELSIRTGGYTYFLSCRDAAKASPGLSFQRAADIAQVLERAGVIAIMRVGNKRKASEFRYLYPASSCEATIPPVPEGSEATEAYREQDVDDQPLDL